MAAKLGCCSAGSAGGKVRKRRRVHVFFSVRAAKQLGRPRRMPGGVTAPVSCSPASGQRPHGSCSAAAGQEALGVVQLLPARERASRQSDLTELSERADALTLRAAPAGVQDSGCLLLWTATELSQQRKQRSRRSGTSWGAGPRRCPRRPP